MIVLDNAIVYTADDEDPKCDRCDNCVGDFDCSGLCGSQHGWYGYCRVELKDKET